MKTKLLLFFFCFTLIGALAQPTTISGRVYDQKTNEPLPFVNITYNNSKQGAAADIDGRFFVTSPEPITSLTFSFVGYEKFTMPITPNTPLPLQVYMREITTQLWEVEVVAGENPAHRIIKNAVANRAKNNPTNLGSFSYTSYNKLILTVQTDSLPLVDTAGNADSSNIELQNFIDSQHLFLMESVSERKYKKPNKDNEVVTANRVSGLENPTFVLLANQLQSFSFYDDFVTVLSQDYLNPITTGSTAKYLFLLQDTTFSGLDTTFVIAFQPKKDYRFKPLTGLLYINTNGWAIQNVVAEPFEKTEGFGIKIQQRYEQFLGGSWFPVQMNYDFKFYNLNVNGVQPVGIGRTYLRDVKINPAFEKSDFSVIDLKIEDDATKKEDAFWNNYRADSLDYKERETYRVVDSIGDAENFELKLKWLTALSEGKIRWKIFDFPLENLMRYNIYEGFRIGFGAETNANLVDWLRVGGNWAYGFKDQTIKYGYFGELILHKEQNLRVGGGYQFDIYESGGDQWIDEPQRTIITEGNTRMLWIQQFDELSEAFGYVKWHPLPNLHSKFQLSRQNRFMPGNYAYQTVNAENQAVWQNGFVAGLLQASVVWAPNDEYMEGPFGRRPMVRTYPTIDLQYTQGFTGLFDGTLDFKRLDFKIRHDVKTIKLGVSSVVLGAGKVLGDVPYSYLFNGRSNLPNGQNSTFLFVADQLSFETMRNNEFLNDEFVQLMFRQNFEQRILKIGTWAPDVEVMLRALWGNLAKPQLHRGINFSDAAKGFYETGLEINKIFNSLGLGVYYRFGPYHLPTEQDNWAVKLSYRVTLF